MLRPSPHETGRMATKDHILPRSKGGKRRDNLALACRTCNGKKADLTIEEFYSRYQKWLILKIRNARELNAQLERQRNGLHRHELQRLPTMHETG